MDKISWINKIDPPSPIRRNLHDESSNPNPMLTALTELLCSPQLGCVLRPDLAELYIKDVDAYNRNASEFCKHHSEKQNQH
ncbi:unnamed protein product [Wuchereria bancrofti]|uniref:UBC core domain-containing protein n=1 Tax=Wuchereria bancrofti TaxID=6293 RepID=A0A3P7F006_WUCBA|nr:unnamed protein product [Wuchereria bancrofti]